MNAEDQRISERVSSPGRCRRLFRGIRRFVGVVFLVFFVGGLTLPSLILALVGPSQEVLFAVVVLYAVLLFVLGPTELAEIFLISPVTQFDSFELVRPVRLRLAFALVLAIVYGVAAMLSKALLPLSLKWLTLIGVYLLLCFIVHKFIAPWENSASGESTLK